MLEGKTVKSYLITYEPGLGYIFEVKQSDLPDRQAIILEDHEAVNDFLQEFGQVYQNSLPSSDWSF